MNRLHHSLLGFALAMVPVPGFAQQSSIVGAWEPTAYVLESGTSHAVDGRIFFTDIDWTVLFFVSDGDGLKRGSAEGGTYTTDGDELVFAHRFHLSVGEEMEGMPASALRMEMRPVGEATLEASTFNVEGDGMTLFFPSGNRMEFRRASSF